MREKKDIKRLEKALRRALDESIGSTGMAFKLVLDKRISIYERFGLVIYRATQVGDPCTQNRIESWIGDTMENRFVNLMSAKELAEAAKYVRALARIAGRGKVQIMPFRIYERIKDGYLYANIWL